MLGAYNFSHLGLVALGSAFKVAGVKQYIVFNWIMFTSTGYKLSSIQHCLEVHVYRILLPAFLLGQNKKVKKNLKKIYCVIGFFPAILLSLKSMSTKRISYHLLNVYATG